MLASLSFALLASAGSPGAPELVAVQAGTIHVVAEGRVIEGGGTLLIRDGKVVAVDKSSALAVPPGARVVDYGPSAVIAPGLVCADSTFGRQLPAERTADVGIRAADNFDLYASYASTLASGVTTAYVPPARGRLISGQGAVVKLAGGPGATRFLSTSAAIEGSISSDARNTPGYWEPPIPATVDVGLGVEQRQLPRTTMGAILALRELLALAAEGGPSKEYGPYVGPELAQLLAKNRPWRMRAESVGEIRALLGFFGENGLPLVLSGAGEADELAAELARAGVAVIWNVPLRPNAPPLDRGKDEESRWPRYDVASKLAAGGVRFAIAPAVGGPASTLRFAATVASRAGLSEELVLRALTLTPAEILGVADRVGSLAPGRDADLVVTSGSPLAPTSSVIATWVEGEVVWKVKETAATVLEVEELHVGDGTILAPAQILLLDGRIAEVGRLVARPEGSTVVRGQAAMPGMIDARGHLGLEGSSKVPAARFELKRLVEPGDYADRRVAAAGVTSVILTPRGVGSGGTPSLAYKPAGVDLESMVIADPVALNVQWSPERNPNRHKAGESVRELLRKGAEYKKRWDDYEVALKSWTPPPPAPPAAEPAKKEGSGEEPKAEGEGETKKEKEEEPKDAPPKPFTGTWETEVVDPASGEKTRLRLRLLHEGEKLEGNLRCNLASDSLVELSGALSEGAISISGLGSRGRVLIEGKVIEVEKKKDAKKKKDEKAAEEAPQVRRLAAKLSWPGGELEFEAPQTGEDYPVARRPERRKEKSESAPEPKGKPKSPGINPDLEPVRAALEGRIALVVEVYRADEILDCVRAHEEVGIRPILFGADEAWKVAGELRGRVAGVLLDHRVTYSDAEMGTRSRNRYAELQSAGIPVAFQSSAEEGAAELPMIAAYAVANGMSPVGAIRALTSDAAEMFRIGHRVGRVQAGLDADVLLLDGSPLRVGTGVQRAWVAGREVRLR